MSKAKCKNCKDVIESRYTHEWVCCSCFSKSSEAVNIYRRSLPEDEQNLQATWDRIKEMQTGFFIDGGDAYLRYGGTFKHIEWIDPKDPHAD